MKKKNNLRWLILDSSVTSNNEELHFAVSKVWLENLFVSWSKKYNIHSSYYMGNVDNMTEDIFEVAESQNAIIDTVVMRN